MLPQPMMPAFMFVIEGGEVEKIEKKYGGIRLILSYMRLIRKLKHGFIIS